LIKERRVFEMRINILEKEAKLNGKGGEKR